MTWWFLGCVNLQNRRVVVKQRQSRPLSSNVASLQLPTCPQVWTNWYYPLLRPGHHYFPTTPQELGNKLQWCLDHDAACEAVARRARERMAQLTLDMTYDYVHKQLAYAHDLQNTDTAPKVCEGKC